MSRRSYAPVLLVLVVVLIPALTQAKWKRFRVKPGRLARFVLAKGLYDLATFGTPAMAKAALAVEMPLVPTLGARHRTEQVEVRRAKLPPFIQAARPAKQSVMAWPASREQVTIHSEKGGRIVVESRNPATAVRQAMALKQWTQRIGEQPSMFRGITFDPKTQTASIDVTDIVPALVRRESKVNPHSSGFNCWATALMGAKLVNTKRYVDAPEMTYWLDTPMCQMRTGRQIPKPGDVLAVRGSHGDEVHGIVYITPEIVFSKNGYNRRSAPDLQAAGDVFGVYGVQDACKLVNGKPATGSACASKSYTNVYACQTLGQFIKQNPEYQVARQPKQVRALLRKVAHHEKSVFLDSVNELKLTDGERAGIQSDFATLSMQARQALGGTTSPATRFWLESSLQRMGSIGQQLGISQRSRYEAPATTGIEAAVENGGRVTISGQASLTNRYRVGGRSIKQVEVELNRDGRWSTANGTDSWRAKANGLTPGTHEIRARATNTENWRGGVSNPVVFEVPALRAPPIR
jgi:hypothetical protein